MGYQSSGTVKCWKKYDCLGCGAVFRHRFERTVSGTGGTPAQAQASAQRAGLAALQHQVDVVPCPECGRIQPRMVGHEKNEAHFVLAALALALGAVLVVLGATDALTRDASAFAAAGAAAVAGLGHLLFARSDPNRDPAANRAAVARKVKGGEVDVVRAGDPDAGEPPPRLVGPGHVVYLALAALAVAAALAPVAARHLSGWALTDADPPVVGPGDTFRVTFPDKIDCVRGTWSGTPALQFDGPPVPGAAAASKSDAWGNSMAVKSSEQHTSPTLWADVALPPDPALEDREVAGTVTLRVRFPQAVGTNGMQDRETTVTKRFAVRLSKVNAWRSFRRVWWAGLVSSVLLTGLAGWGFARLAARMKWDSPPDLIESPDTPPDDRPPEERARDRAPAAEQAGREPPRRPWERG